MNKFYPAGIVIVVAVFAVAVIAGGTAITHFLSLPSLALVVVPALAMSLSTGSLRETGTSFRAAYASSTPDRAQLRAAESYFQALGRYFIAAGVVGFILGAVVLLANLGGDPHIIGAGTAVALLTVLYSIILYLVIPVPFGSAIRRKLARLEG